MSDYSEVRAIARAVATHVNRSTPRDKAKMAKNDRRAYFKKRYGLTPDQVDAEIAIRQGRCDICSKEKPLNVDHDHDTGRVRGMLCHQCNLALGQMADDPVRLRAAADYLEAYEGPRGDLHHRGPWICCD